MKREPPKKEGNLTMVQALEAARAGKVVMEQLPSGAHRRINPERRTKKLVMRKLGLSGRGWRKLQKQMRRGR